MKELPIEIKNKIIENLSKGKVKNNDADEKNKFVESAIIKLSFELLANDVTYKNLTRNKKIIKEIFDRFFQKNVGLVSNKDEIIKKSLYSLNEEK